MSLSSLTSCIVCLLAIAPLSLTSLADDYTQCGCSAACSEGGIAYETNTHAAITRVALTNQLCTVDDFLREELLLGEGINTIATGLVMVLGEQIWVSEPMLYWSEHGAIAEDDAPRYFHHFHDPLRKQGLQWEGPDGNDAIVWAMSWSSNEWNLKEAAKMFRDSLISVTPQTRSAKSANAFAAIGHFMHLIQDVGQPAHTRNDPHPTRAWLEYYASDKFGAAGSLVWQSGGQAPSPLTIGIHKVRWFGAATSQPATVPYFELVEPLPDFSCLGDPWPLLNSGGHFRRWFDTNYYRNWWENQQGTPFPGFPCSPGLAEYSNMNFFSEDTIFSANYPHPTFADTNFVDVVSQQIPTEDELYTVHFVEGGTYGSVMLEPIGPIGTEHYLCAAERRYTLKKLREHFDGPAPIKVEVGQNHNHVLESYCQKLIPKAIAYCTDFANYFFRGRLGVSVAANPQTGKVEVTITSLSDDTLTTGEWLLMHDTHDGLRYAHDVNWSAYPGTLAHRQSFSVEYTPPATPRTGPYTLVFKANGETDDDFTIEVVAKVYMRDFGPCCVNNVCAERTDVECAALGGTFLGVDAACEDYYCTGVCCFADGTCQDEDTEAHCVQQEQGTFYPFLTCADLPCPGACCLPGNDCDIMTVAECTAQNGTFKGPGTECSECYPPGWCYYRLVPCPNPCPDVLGEENLFVTCNNAQNLGLSAGSEVKFPADVNEPGCGRCAKLEAWPPSALTGPVVSLWEHNVVQCGPCRERCPCDCGPNGANCSDSYSMTIGAMTVIDQCGDTCDVPSVTRTAMRANSYVCSWYPTTPASPVPIQNCSPPNPVHEIVGVGISNPGISCHNGKWQTAFTVWVWSNDSGCNCLASTLLYERTTPAMCDDCPTGTYTLISPTTGCVQSPPTTITVN